MTSAVTTALVVTIAAPALAVFIALTANMAVSVLNHGNHALAYTVDRMLRRIVVSPDMHRIHYSMLDEESNRNFGGIFPWWDRLFGTYLAQPRLAHEGMQLGISEAPAAADVSLWNLLVMPFRGSPRALRA
jgi:sterol desaturase/sphingolipid hydroxylase (fatty acid hydroxylase superfamily)